MVGTIPTFVQDTVRKVVPEWAVAQDGKGGDADLPEYLGGGYDPTQGDEYVTLSRDEMRAAHLHWLAIEAAKNPDTPTEALVSLAGVSWNPSPGYNYADWDVDKALGNHPNMPDHIKAIRALGK